MKMIHKFLAVSVAAVIPQLGFAASHREAPAIALDPAADITDVYAFRSWEDPSKLVFIMNVIPAQEPSSAPNYFNFDDKVAYEIHLDTNQDGKANDIVYRVRFNSEIRPPYDDFPLAYAGVDGIPGLTSIKALNGPGSEGIGLRQSYTVTEYRPGQPNRVLNNRRQFAVPANIGPRTIPDYEALSDKGIYPLKNGGRVFAGQRDETFYIDLGATFDTLNFRAPPILSALQDGNDKVNPFGNDMFSGFNVSTIAIEVPIAEVTSTPDAVIGMYASTNRYATTTLNGNGSVTSGGSLVQVSRMGNPLINELVIGTGDKDLWNAMAPIQESAFLDYYLNPRLTGVINLAFGTSFPVTGRTDLVAALLKYPGQKADACTAKNPCSELLRLNVGVAPTAPESQKRLTVLAGDAAGFPNGRRPNDDVTDVGLRVLAGALLGPVPNLGDGVNFNIGAEGGDLTDNGIYKVFPFLPKAHDGRNRRHIDCGETDANPCN
ncbi:MAG: DUF4331 domain-containing protein [Methylovulum sp.]|nr:DUF4331 domain-containing protein [Methylovulum sp.]